MDRSLRRSTAISLLSSARRSVGRTTQRADLSEHLDQLPVIVEPCPTFGSRDESKHSDALSGTDGVDRAAFQKADRRGLSGASSSTPAEAGKASRCWPSFSSRSATAKDEGLSESSSLVETASDEGRRPVPCDVGLLR